VVSITVEEGGRVTRGYPLARLDTQTLQATRGELSAQRTRAVSQLDEMRAGPQRETIAAARAQVHELREELALAALWFFGYRFGFTAIVGTLGLIGAAVNDSIVVLAALRNHPQARQGNPNAVYDVVLRSTRHVLSTSVTTIAGFAPLLIGGGEFWPPLATAIAGGVAGATILGLYLVPSAYLLLMRYQPHQPVPHQTASEVLTPAEV
jgi:preprotein translocase subunit SecF